MILLIVEVGIVESSGVKFCYIQFVFGISGNGFAAVEDFIYVHNL